MKLFCTWCRLHKIKFTLLVLYALACGATLRVDVVWGLVVMALGYGVWAIVYALDTNEFIGLLVAVSLLSVSSARAFEFAQSRESFTEDLAGHGTSDATGQFYRVKLSTP